MILVYSFAITDESRARAAKVVEHAIKPAHWYRPTVEQLDADGPGTPGNIHEHVALCGGCRCVFSVTLFPDLGPGHDEFTERPSRHLSMSAPFVTPEPDDAVRIARLFGFRFPKESYASSDDIEREPGTAAAVIQGKVPIVVIVQVAPDLEAKVDA